MDIKGSSNSHNNQKQPLLPTGMIRVNYLYFGFFFLGLCLIHIYHLFVIERASLFSQSYYLLYAIAQCFLETVILVLVCSFVENYLPRICTFLFVLFVFLLFIFHLVDFPLTRLMDWSIWYVLSFVIDEKYENFVEMLYASHISLFSWILSGITAGVLLFVGFMIFRFSEKLSIKKPLYLHRRHLFATLCLVSLLLVSWEQGMKQYFPHLHSTNLVKSLPWKATFVPPSDEFIMLANPLKEDKRNTKFISKISPADLKRRPNIFLFVIESMREDFITSEITPNLNTFKKENISFDLAFSSANATQISWFSLLNSKFPFYYGKFDETSYEKGALPLQIFQKMGYKIHVYSSARLSYYRMDELIFGKDKYLADGINLFPHDDEIEAYQSDGMTIGKLCEDIEVLPEEGNVFITFLESTHFHYSFPKSETLPFSPIIDEINYFKAAIVKDDLEAIKNRYRNALYYIDSLFGKFISTLNQTAKKDEALIVVTGDHGEEFFERGHLFHASNLSTMQVHVPLYYKLGKKRSPANKKSCTLTSHIDIFPTLLHYVADESVYEGYLDGESIYKENKWPFTVSARYNASRTPVEFFIHNGTDKLHCRFNEEREIFTCQKLDLLALRDNNDEPLPFNVPFVEEKFQAAFDTIFSP